MSLSASEQQALDSIKDSLASSDPTLVARLTMFARLASGEEMPVREKIHAGSRRTDRRSGPQPGHPRREAVLRRGPSGPAPGLAGCSAAAVAGDNYRADRGRADLQPRRQHMLGILGNVLRRRDIRIQFGPGRFLNGPRLVQSPRGIGRAALTGWPCDGGQADPARRSARCLPPSRSGTGPSGRGHQRGQPVPEGGGKDQRMGRARHRRRVPGLTVPSARTVLGTCRARA